MGVEPAIDITAEQRRTILALLDRHLPDTQAWVYGSRVKWTSRPQSDLDLVVFATPEQRRQVGDLREALGESDLPFRVDLFVWDEVPEPFRKEIENDHVAVVKSDTLSKETTANCSRSWSESLFGELTENFDSVRVPVKHAERVAGLYPYYGASGVVDHVGDYLLDGEYLLVAEDGENLRSRNTPIAFLANGKFWVNNHAHVVRGNQKADTRFLMYALSQLDISGYLTGSTMPKLTQDNMNRIRLSLPPLSEQRAIAHILGTLDDKIELNRRINVTLEAIAQALFRSWFVDFDPVRAKMEGRDTGLPKDIADLFPDRLVDSTLGQIPKGWTLGTLSDVAASPRKAIDPASVGHDTPYIGLEHMPRGSVALTDWGTAGSISSNKSCFEIGDILFGKLRPYFHKVGIAPVNGVCSTDIVVLRARIPAWSAFVLTCVSSSVFVAHTSQTSTGTKMPRTNWQTMSTYELCQPTDVIATAFQQVVSLMLERIVVNVHESRTLGVLRDALLPKSLAGELQANDLGPACEPRGHPATVDAHEASRSHARG